MKKTQVVRFNNRSLQKGTSLLEGIAYLGIAALVILGAIALLMSAFGGANSNKAQQEISSIRTGVKRLYMGQAATYGTGSLNDSLIAAKVFPTTLTVNGSNVTNAWNGAVGVTGATSQFNITYANVPKDVCINLVSVSGEWQSVAVNSGTARTPPITPTQASTDCSSSNSNSIVWTAN